jgi:hypothetical protein
MRTSLPFGIAVLVLAGCASSPPAPTPQVEPPVIETPPAGTALIYFFRPTLDKTGQRASPSLLVNSGTYAQLPYSSYTVVQVPAGMHRFELKPSDTWESQWATAAQFCAVAGKVYFAAVWNQAQPLRQGSTVAVLPGGIFIPIPLGPGSTRGSVVFEVVDPALGRESLAGLKRSGPLQTGTVAKSDSGPAC